MRKYFKTNNFIMSVTGIGVLILTIFLVVAVFAAMVQADKEDVSLWDMPGVSNGWAYETLTEDGEIKTPSGEFNEETGNIDLGEQVAAIKITRVMTETLVDAELRVSPGACGVEIFLEDELIYTDFAGAERMQSGYLALSGEERAKYAEEFRQVSILMPWNYTGKQLSIISYFPENAEMMWPTYPHLTSMEAEMANVATAVVFPMAAIAISAVILVLLAIIFFMEIRSGKSNFSILLLLLAWLLFFFETAANSMPGWLSILGRINMQILEKLYVVPLCLYIGMQLTSWRKWLSLAGGMTAFGAAIYRMLLLMNDEEMLAAGMFNGLEILLPVLLVLVMLIWECIGFHVMRTKILNFETGMMLVVSVCVCAWHQALEWDGNIVIYFSNLITTLQEGALVPLTHLLADIFIFMALMVHITAFVKNVLHTRQMVGALEERNRFAVESYKIAMESAQANRRWRHEVRHHMMMLSEMLQGQEPERAKEYLASLVGGLDKIPVAKYSNNMIINAIAGIYLGRAEKESIHVQYQFAVPEQLPMKEEDLCILVTNILENALEACERMEKKDNRFIHINMNCDNGFLFVSCENSMEGTVQIESDGTIISSKDDKNLHGCGVTAIRNVAEKYGSVAKVDVSENIFVVKTNLCLG